MHACMHAYVYARQFTEGFQDAPAGAETPAGRLNYKYNL